MCCNISFKQCAPFHLYFNSIFNTISETDCPCHMYTTIFTDTLVIATPVLYTFYILLLLTTFPFISNLHAFYYSDKDYFHLLT